MLFLKEQPTRSPKYGWLFTVKICDDFKPEMCVDGNGIIHCVWTRDLTVTKRCIYYSSSSDQGDSWTTPENISQNNEGFSQNVEIVCDDNNQLHIVYTNTIGATDNIFYQNYSGTSWSTPHNITFDFPGANNSSIVVDHSGRVYVFWILFWQSRFYYKYYENGLWSDANCPYPDTCHVTLYGVVADQSNNLHCIGQYYTSDPYQMRKAYFQYNRSTNLWDSTIQIISDNFPLYANEDIALDNLDNPHCVWKQYSGTGTTPPEATAYSFNSGPGFSSPVILVEDPCCQKINIVNNNVFIIDGEKQGQDRKIVFYRKDSENEWYGTDLPWVYDYIYPKGMQNDSTYLYLLLYGKIQNPDILDIYITKTLLDSLIITSISSKIKYLGHETIVLEQNYPNPVVNKTRINFELAVDGNVLLYIADLQGRIVRYLINEKIIKGRHSVIWDGRDENGSLLPPGYYYYRLKASEQVKTKSILLLN